LRHHKEKCLVVFVTSQEAVEAVETLLAVRAVSVEAGTVLLALLLVVMALPILVEVAEATKKLLLVEAMVVQA
jgi:hypothetical protein